MGELRGPLARTLEETSRQEEDDIKQNFGSMQIKNVKNSKYWVNRKDIFLSLNLLKRQLILIGLWSFCVSIIVSTINVKLNQD